MLYGIMPPRSTTNFQYPERLVVFPPPAHYRPNVGEPPPATHSVVTPALREALYQVAAGIPGVKLVGHARRSNKPRGQPIPPDGEVPPHIRGRRIVIVVMRERR
jgi:hypothetical protein